MRTTVDIDNEQRAALLKIAAERGKRGFSSVLREAVDLYIREHRPNRKAVERALKLEGSMSRREGKAMLSNIRALRKRWRWPTIFPLTYEDARLAAGLERQLASEGKMISFPDYLIAAVCIANGAELLTTDSDFARIPALKLA